MTLQSVSEEAAEIRVLPTHSLSGDCIPLRLLLRVSLVMCLLNNSDVLAFTRGRFLGSLDFSQNFLSLSPPDVTFGIEVMLREVLHNRVHQLADAAETAG